MEVGRRIREERERSGLSQEALAHEIFVSRQTVSNWETGKTYPDVQSLLLLSKLFDVSVDSLVKGDLEAMEKKMETYELARFKMNASMVLACALVVLGAAIAAASVTQGVSYRSPIYVIALAVTAAGIVSAFVADRIKRRYDLETMRELQAFLEGVSPDQIERERRMPKAVSVALKVLAGAAVGALLMFVLLALFELVG